jgi:CRISPR-associated protein Cmr5
MSLEQEIADLALTRVRERYQKDDPDHKEETAYRSLCESFPILLRTAGLRKTIAFLQAKGKEPNEQRILLDHLTEQLRNLGRLDNSKLHDKIMAMNDLTEYRAYTQFAMQIALWHKRMAQALLRKKDEK